MIISSFSKTIQKILGGWRANLLSLAGRETIIKSSVKPIITYYSQCEAIPNSTCEAIDQAHRLFLWGRNQAKKKMSLVKYNKVAKLKESGILGLRKSSHVNKIGFTKLHWRILKHKKEKWASTLHKKYIDHHRQRSKKISF